MARARKPWDHASKAASPDRVTGGGAMVLIKAAGSENPAMPVKRNSRRSMLLRTAPHHRAGPTPRPMT